MNFAICILLAALTSLAVGTPGYGYGDDDDDDRYMGYGRMGGRMYGSPMGRGMYGPGMMGRSYGYMNGGGYPDMYGGRSMMSYGPGMGPMGYGSRYGMMSRYGGHGGHGGHRRRCRCRKRCKYYERYAGKCWWCRHHYCRVRCCRWYY